MHLRAHGDLTVSIEDDGSVRLRSGELDWLGRGVAQLPGIATRTTMPDTSQSFADDLGEAREVVIVDGDVRLSVRAYRDRPLVVFRAEAKAALGDLATDSFDQPCVGWPVFTPAKRDSAAGLSDFRAVAFQHCEFGLPATVDATVDGFFLLPHRPPTGWPLLLDAPGHGSLVIAPLNAFHDQTIGLNGGTVRCGWHGDLETVPAGFVAELGCFAASDVRDGLEAWGTLLQTRAGTVRPGRWSDALATRPSYWTDNGAAYWYRTEPGHDAAGSIVAAVSDLRAEDLRLGAVQLDSWFYPHAELRPFDTDEWLVPPTAMTAWEERPDVLPDGITALRARLDDPPLVAHIRHLSSEAGIADEVPAWRDGPLAVPSTPEGYERWLDQCVAWGVETFEHDWLVEVFFGVRQLRAQPGRARAWQEGIDRAARERGITLQWCMGTPADFAQTTTLTQVTSVRTCGDHGYIATAGQLWAWFCTTNALARALGLAPFKDVFRTDPEVAGRTGEIEAILSVLSTGPVGLGDRVGRCDTALARATSRADGVLIKPDVPVTATAATMLANTAFVPGLHVAETHSRHPAGLWSYVVAMHTHPSDERLSGTVELQELGASTPEGEVIVWDHRARTARRVGASSALEVDLDLEEWAYFLLTPVLPGELAVIGDVSKLVPAGDARIEVASLDGAGCRVTVKGAGETVTVTGWSAACPVSSRGALTYDPDTEIWAVTIDVPARGWTSFDLRTA